jgi:periplasmic protein TonB
MNQLEEQKSLVSFLEDAVAEAKESSSGILEILERELKEASLEREQNLNEPCPEEPQRLQPVVFRERTVATQFQPQFRIPRQSGYLSFLSNLQIVFRSKRADVKVSATPVASNWLFEAAPWYRSIVSQFVDLWSHRRIPKLAVTSQPLEAKELFPEYPFQPTSMVWSAFLHALMLALLLYTPLQHSNAPDMARKVSSQISILIPVKTPVHLPPKANKPGGGGGGGRRDPKPASLGRLPRASDRQLTPPVPEIKNLHPILPVEPTIVAPDLSQLPVIDLPNYGDPFGVPGPPSSGPGTGGGIGTGTGGGVGPGRGPGVGPGEGGGFGGGVYRVGGGVSAPVVILRVEPVYTEEARKAHYQGVVVLWAIVRKDGSLEILKLVRGLGLGLDESAVAALRQWKFRPGMIDGSPVDVGLNVEVSFTLR